MRINGRLSGFTLKEENESKDLKFFYGDHGKELLRINIELIRNSTPETKLEIINSVVEAVCRKEKS